MEEISNEFRKLCTMWDKIQTIFVYSGNGCWMLHIRRRDDYYCSTIEDGWKYLREDLDLNVGDLCVSECLVLSFDHFSVQVLKAEWWFRADGWWQMHLRKHFNFFPVIWLLKHFSLVFSFLALKTCILIFLMGKLL